MLRWLSLAAFLAAFHTAAPASESLTGESAGARFSGGTGIYEPVSEGPSRLSAAYPEGPLVVGGTVLFAEMHRDRITAWSSQKADSFYWSRGCGPTAIAPYGGGYAVFCHRADEIHLISRGGDRFARIDRDSGGKPFINPNDASADGRGGVYFSASGVFSRAARKEGALLYLDSRGAVHRLAGGLHYANGVHFDRRTRRLFVSEHLAGRILAWPERAPGRLGRHEVFARLADAGAIPEGGTELMGPDGLETDDAGNLYAAQYGAGRLFIFSPEGKTLLRLAAPEPLTTNIALGGNDCELIVTGARRTARPPYPGSVRRIANPLCRRRRQ